MPRRTTSPAATVLPAAVLAAITLAGCSSSDSTPTPPPSASSAPDPAGPGSSASASPTPATGGAAPVVPHVTGPTPLVVQPALASFGGGPECLPDAETACAEDGRAYRLVDDPRSVTLLDATTALNEGATAWTTTITLAGARPLTRAARRAAGIGGVVLLLDPDSSLGTRIDAVVEVPDIGGAQVVVNGLDKATAWGLVQRFE